MAYYLVDLVNTAAAGKKPRYRPQGFDQAAHNFITVGAVGDRKALVWFDDPVNVGTKVADGSTESVGVVTRTAFATLSGRSYTGPIGGVVVDLLKDPPLPWGRGALLPSMLRNRYEIWLGPGGRGQNLFYSEPVPPVKHTQRWVDTFNRADGDLGGSTLSGGGATWVAATGGADDWKIVSNQAKLVDLSAETGRTARVDTEVDTDTSYAQVTLLTFTDGAAGDVDIRVSCASDTLNENGYVFSQDSEVGLGPSRSLFTQFTSTVLASDSGPVTLGTMRVVKDGSSISALLNGVPLFGPVTDTGEQSGAGFRYTTFRAVNDADAPADATGLVLIVDNYDAGDLVPGYVLVAN